MRRDVHRSVTSVLPPLFARCAEHADRSAGPAALHNEELGFMGAAELAQHAFDTGKTIAKLTK